MFYVSYDDRRPGGAVTSIVGDIAAAERHVPTIARYGSPQGEILLGLIMVLTFTRGLSVAEAGRDDA
jgi:hypothetical protein